MPIRTIVLLVSIVLIAIFAALNWDIITAQTALSLGFTDVQAPLGLVLLGIMIFMAVLFLVFIVYLQTSVLLEARRHAKELQANRELADQAEASRFTDLRNYLQAELQKMEERDLETKEAILDKVNEMDRDLRLAMEQSGNTLAAYIGELEDRIERTEGRHQLNLPG